MPPRKPPHERKRYDTGGKIAPVNCRLERADADKLEALRTEAEQRTGYDWTTVAVIRALIRREHAARFPELQPDPEPVLPPLEPPPAPERNRKRRKGST